MGWASCGLVVDRWWAGGVRIVQVDFSVPLRPCWHMMVTGSSAVLRAILLELCVALRPALERNTARSHALLVPTGDVTLGAGQPFGTVPVDPEPSHASRVGRIYLYLSQVYQIIIQCG